MSDYSSIRARRRVIADDSYDYNTQVVVDQQEQQKKQQHPVGAAAAQGSFYNPLSTVFAASPTQLWNSAQEAFTSYGAPAPSAPEPLLAEKPVTDPYERLERLCIHSELDLLPQPAGMPSRDRTSEFRTTAKSYQMKVAAAQPAPPNKREVLNESIQFNQLAKRIGRDLSHTCAKMEKLAEIAKKKSLFGERGEVEELSRVVKEDITGLNKQIAALQDYSRRRAGAGGKTQGQDHSNLVVVGLQSKLANVGKDFQSVLEIQTENMKQQKTRRERFSQAADPMMAMSSLPSSSSQNNVRSRLLADDHASSIALDMDHIEQHRAGQQAQSMMMMDQTGAYAQDRANTMESIEGSISELGQIFSQLASLVSEQGEMITRIDSNVEETSLNIDMAHTELVKYFHNISQNRWLMLKIFGVLIVFFVIFVVFLT